MTTITQIKIVSNGGVPRTSNTEEEVKRRRRAEDEDAHGPNDTIMQDVATRSATLPKIAAPSENPNPTNAPDKNRMEDKGHGASDDSKMMASESSGDATANQSSYGGEPTQACTRSESADVDDGMGKLISHISEKKDKEWLATIMQASEEGSRVKLPDSRRIRRYNDK